MSRQKRHSDLTLSASCWAKVASRKANAIVTMAMAPRVMYMGKQVSTRPYERDFLGCPANRTETETAIGGEGYNTGDGAEKPVRWLRGHCIICIEFAPFLLKRY